MPESTPSELLVRAADLIRDRAAAATPGAWEIEEMGWPANGPEAAALQFAQVVLGSAVSPEETQP